MGEWYDGFSIGDVKGSVDELSIGFTSISGRLRISRASADRIMYFSMPLEVFIESGDLFDDVVTLHGVLRYKDACPHPEYMEVTSVNPIRPLERFTGSTFTEMRGLFLKERLGSDG